MVNVPAGHQQNFTFNPFADHSSPAFLPANARVSGGHGTRTGLGSGFGTGLGSVLVFLAGPLPSAGFPVCKAEITFDQPAGASVFEAGSPPDPSVGAPVFKEENSPNPTTNARNPETTTVIASPRRRRSGCSTTLGDMAGAGGNAECVELSGDGVLSGCWSFMALTLSIAIS
jgi:hypothetical protein